MRKRKPLLKWGDSEDLLEIIEDGDIIEEVKDNDLPILRKGLGIPEEDLPIIIGDLMEKHPMEERGISENSTEPQRIVEISSLLLRIKIGTVYIYSY